MAQRSSHPTLTPQFCFSTVALQDFLRVSRASIDDSITQNLNALITPAKAGFDPRSTSQRGRASTRQVAPEACRKFRDNVLFPSWQVRSDVLSYCASVATCPDPDDPDQILRQVQSLKDRERVVNERLDPYSSRFFPQESRAERLAATVRQERGVEKIVRARSWNAVKERCGLATEEWEEALNAWQGGKRRAASSA